MTTAEKDFVNHSIRKHRENMKSHYSDFIHKICQWRICSIQQHNCYEPNLQECYGDWKYCLRTFHDLQKIYTSNVDKIIWTMIVLI